jgi:uncharacterized protein (DUF2164 family)
MGLDDREPLVGELESIEKNCARLILLANFPNKEAKRLHMAIELPKEARQNAINSIQKYFEANLEERIGNLEANALLGFILEEIGPSIYNKGVADAQERMQARLNDLDYEVHEDEFQYWRNLERRQKGRK